MTGNQLTRTGNGAPWVVRWSDGTTSEYGWSAYQYQLYTDPKNRRIVGPARRRRGA